MTHEVSRDEIDQHIGRQLKLRRLILGKTLNEIGKTIGVSFQQVQKYERGTNSISSSTLLLIARALDVEVGYFYESILKHHSSSEGKNENKLNHAVDPNDKEVMNIARCYHEIRCPDIKEKAVELMRLLANI